MKRALSVICFISLLAAACRQGGLRREEKKYDVVEEGSASGVTATINAPGETPPPMPTLTGTNADTTTTFMLPNTATDTTTAGPGTIAGTFPTDNRGSIPAYPRDTPSRSVRPPSPAPAPTPPTETTATETAAPSAEPEEAPAPEDAPEEPPPPPPPPPTTTDTRGPGG